MIQLMVVRDGIHMIAYTVNDNNEVLLAAAFTRWGAERRLIRLLAKMEVK